MNEQKDEIIEEWMRDAYPEMSDIRDLELSEGIAFVDKLNRLIDITEENLTKHNNDLKKDCYMFMEEKGLELEFEQRLGYIQWRFMMRLIKNFIGRIQGYSGCAKCKDTFNWKKHKDIWYDKSSSMFALCEECFNKLDIQEIIYWYEELLNDHIKSSPINYPSERIKEIKQTLRNNIIKEKNIEKMSLLKESEK